MNDMFNNCTGLQTIYVASGWATSQVKNSNKMFFGCTELVGSIPYNAATVDKTYATTENGYLTLKAA